MEVKEMVKILKRNYPQYGISLKGCDYMSGDSHVAFEITMSKRDVGDSLIGVTLGITDFVRNGQPMTDFLKEDSIIAAGRVVDGAVKREEASTAVF